MKPRKLWIYPRKLWIYPRKLWIYPRKTWIVTGFISLHVSVHIKCGFIHDICGWIVRKPRSMWVYRVIDYPSFMWVNAHMSKPLSLRSPDLAPLLAKFRELCTDTNFQVVKVAYLKSLPGGERQVLHTDTKEGCISALIPLNCQLNVRLYFLSIFMY